MARIFSSCCLIFMLIFTGSSGALAQSGEMTQYSTIDVLLKGVYEGYVPIGEMLRHGDTGIGTFDGLDGEMVVVDGIAYQVTGDGVVHIPEPAMTTPFAAVTSSTTIRKKSCRRAPISIRSPGRWTRSFRLRTFSMP